ncbi:putative esterase [Larkinella arboricola]|uniref:Putative esterase n=1 Tax=Larkinella arboricola TaxID=643671 RepID=A0A327WWA4_LARAB|nr:alpha/beta hydrolase-fold protein [Larkinella arboricola]RAJ95735.1 putative esterase [Larkinella arboricola]
MKISILPALSFFFVFLITCPAHSQTAPARKGTAERIKVHGKGLEGNLSGDSPDREVSVYLPPSYKTDKKRRYPVLYLLHGFTDNDAQWYGFTKHWINLPEVVDKAFADPAVREMIIVTPNAYTRFFGSFYSNSITTGNWEDFVAKELVSYIDSHYRTIPNAASRGLTGHSMGGYGTMRIGQKYPEIFSSIYLLSPCCMNTGIHANRSEEAARKIEAIQTIEEVQKADFGTKAAFATSASWSPNPSNPPFYLDLPTKNGQVQPMVMAKWAANAPLAMIDQYIPNLKKLNAIAFDAGSKDESIAASIKVLDGVLNNYKIKHTYEEYEGDHVNRIAERIEKKVLQFFSEHLSFEQPKRK